MGLLTLAGWSAYLAALAAGISITALFLFFSSGGIFGKINDVASIFQMVFLIPVVVALNTIFSPISPVLSLITLVLGMTARRGSPYCSHCLSYAEPPLRPVLALGGLLGIW